jgi:alpha-galactosidase
MRDSGYRYVNIDDCWGAGSRDADGGLVAIKTQFPGGMRTLADSLHAMGLKFGLYTDVFEWTCAKFYNGAGQPGMWQHNQQDADTFVSWGVDYLKVDYCSGSVTYPGTACQQYSAVRDALKQAVTDEKNKGNANAHTLVFSICDQGTQSPWLWGDTVGHLWRTGNDISTSWATFWSEADGIISLYPYAGPGGWNDPDMMEIGNGMSTSEDRAHFSLWCMLCAPLIAGNDIRTMSAATKTTLTNREVIRVNQDSLGSQGRKVVSGSSSEVLSKKMKDGGYSVLFVNLGAAAASVGATWAQIGSADPAGTGLTASTQLWGRDLWGRKDLGKFTGSYTAQNIPIHDVAMVRFYTYDYTITTETEYVATLKSEPRFRVSQTGAMITIDMKKSGVVMMSIIDLKGRVMHEFHGHGPATWNVPKPVSGLYFVKIRAGADQNADVQRLLVN